MSDPITGPAETDDRPPDPETADHPLIRLDSVSRTFHMGDVQVRALEDVSLEIPAGDFIVILGPSGSGKSTLLNVIGGIDRPTNGEFWFDGRSFAHATERDMTAYRRRRVGFIFQFYNLVPTLTALENVQVATELVENPIPPMEALRMVHLEDRANHFPSQLSGGEQQRVATARALAKRPELLLGDEPTGALDLPAARRVLGILQQLNRERGLTVVVITHNAAIAPIARRTVRIVSGRIAEVRENRKIIAADEINW